MRPGQTVFTYFHLAADRELTEGVLATGAHCFAYETLEVKASCPPGAREEVAGRPIQAGAKYLEKPAGGVGCSSGGSPAWRPRRSS